MAKLSFELWKIKANAMCERVYGLSLDDLPDVNYYDMYEAGKSPLQAAKSAIKSANGGDYL